MDRGWIWRSGCSGRWRITPRRPSAPRWWTRTTRGGSEGAPSRYRTRPARSSRRPRFDSTTRLGSPRPRASACRTPSSLRKPRRRWAFDRFASRSSRRRPRTSTCSCTAARRRSGSTRRSPRGSSTSSTRTRTAPESSRSWCKTRMTPAPPRSACSSTKPRAAIRASWVRRWRGGRAPRWWRGTTRCFPPRTFTTSRG